MTYRLTVEQMTANAEGYQEQLREAEMVLSMVQYGSQEWRMAFRRKKEAEAMLEEYLGWTERKGAFIEDAVAPDGKSIGHWEKEVFHKGVIQKKLEEPEQLLDEANLGERFKTRTFASFDAKRDRESFDACSKYANDDRLMDRKRNGLILAGGYGSGKTHLAAAISNTLIERGIPVLFGTSISHLEAIRNGINDPKLDGYLSKMKVTPVLVIDDLGKEKKSNWTRQILFDVINYRYEHMLPTIITTNLIEGDDCGLFATHVEGAVWSRLCEMCNFVITKGSDYRQEA